MALDSHPVRNVVVGAPADGWDTFVDALGTAGFLAADRLTPVPAPPERVGAAGLDHGE